MTEKRDSQRKYQLRRLLFFSELDQAFGLYSFTRRELQVATNKKLKKAKITRRYNLFLPYIASAKLSSAP